MKVLVTGATGLIGVHTVKSLLDAGINVVTCGRSSTGIVGLPSVSHRSGDLLDAAFHKTVVDTERPDGLLHLAWQTKHGHFWNALDNHDWHDASRDLIDRFLQSGGSRVVVSGSCAEYDWRNIPVGMKLSEDAPCGPATLYGQQKLRLLVHCHDLIKSGAAVAWGRLFFLLGPHEDRARFIPSITTKLLAGETADMSSGQQIRDFMHVKDVGRAFATLMQDDITGAINIASGNGYSLLEIATRLQRKIGLGTLNAGGFPDRPDDPPYLVADTGRLSRMIGFTAEYDLDSALSDCINFWANQ
ncbi:NAD-dependent epimerase/dehydratase family protein [Thalassospira xiamenensis]|uniref:NAD-dependent epimerase/dehydratase family protein n=1 Tax=Thalassospira xiamenensis TaxID=220697 RepID=UPI003AA8E15E